jgi:hypothetical protein
MPSFLARRSIESCHRTAATAQRQARVALEEGPGTSLGPYAAAPARAAQVDAICRKSDTGSGVETGPLSRLYGHQHAFRSRQVSR